MSTFKRSFAYAEAVLRIMDSVDEGFAPIEICEKFDWTFPGGTFGVRKPGEPPCPHAELSTSGTVIPGGHMSAWVDEMAERKRMNYSGIELYPETVRGFLRRRRAIFRTSFKSKASWVSVAKYLVESSTRASFGMTAVYSLASSVMNASSDRDNVRVKISDDFKLLTREMYLGGSASSSLSMADLSVIHEIFHEAICKLGVPYLTECISKLESALAQATRCRPTSEDADVYDDVAEEGGFGEEELDWDYRSDIVLARVRLQIRPKCVVWRTGLTSYCLGTSDLRKVIALVVGVRNYLVGICSDAATSYPTRGSTLLKSASLVKKHMRVICAKGATLRNGNHLDFCKAYKSALAVVKAHIAGPMSIRYVPDLMDDVKALPIYDHVEHDFTEFVSDCVSLPPTGALPLAKVFRLLPPPDVWIHDALRERWLESSVIRNVGPERCAQFKVALREVIMTALMKDKSAQLKLKNPSKKPAWWSAYLDRRYEDVPTDELYKECVSAGTVSIVERSRYDPTVWKDSGCGADNLDVAQDDRTPSYTRNFLMRMIYDPSCPMPEDDFHEGQGISQAGLKGESHKKRIFYSNNVASRMLQSRCDATVGEVMSHHPSFAIQKTGVERDDIFNDLSSPPNDEEFCRMTGIRASVCSLLYSFDIKNWSANMPGDIQQASHEVWDHFTSSDLFSRTTRNHNGAIVYCIQDGLTSWYTNGTANFEGYNGKEMTALHIAIMTIAVRNLRERIPDLDPRMLSINLQAYIDDGLARLILPRNIALSVFNIWCDVVVDTWKDFGFTIERKKSFPSPAYFEFLGEEYFAGAHLATGSKAAMRITAEPFEEYESFRDRVTKLSTACRGASVAGLPPPSAYLLQSYMVALETRRWVNIHNYTAVAAWLLAPVSLGGVGMPSLFQQATNASGATTEESMTTLWYWAQSNASVKTAYVALVRRGMARRSAADILSVPLGGQFSERVLKQNPVGKNVIRKLRRDAEFGRLSTLGALMMKLDETVTDDSFQRAVVETEAGAVYQEAILNDIADPMPNRIFRSFISRFESARTISQFVGRKAIGRVIKFNRAEAKLSYRSFVALAKMAHGGDHVTRVGTVLRRNVDTSVI